MARAGSEQNRIEIRGLRRCMAAAMAIAFLMIVAVSEAQAQTYTALHKFTGPDGDYPAAGLSMDRAGNLYGTASQGGNFNDCDGAGCGTVFELERKASGWIFSVLYAFSGPDGQYPLDRVILGPDGNLYGTTPSGGAYGYGVVFRLQPPPTVCKATLCPWTETVLHSFTGGSDGAIPDWGDLAFDQAGNIYGTTPAGGSSTCTGGCGVVYELSPSNGWKETVLYSFQNGTDGANPSAGIIFDQAGNLYGTAPGGRYGGVVYELSRSAGGWVETTLANLQSSAPVGGLIFDSAGNLYGATLSPYGTGGPMVYELSPASGGWTLQEIYNFAGVEEGSHAQVTMDPAGNLYGTLVDGWPEVFRLTQESGQWTLTGFNSGAGESPYGNVVLDTSGNLYTTASAGPVGYAGVIFEITP